MTSKWRLPTPVHGHTLFMRDRALPSIRSSSMIARVEAGASTPSSQAPRPERGILFADFCNSSRLFHQLGDERGRAIVDQALDCARAAIEQERGRVVDSIGDELFCSCPDADSGVRAGVGLQERIAAARQAGKLPSDVRLRVGLHHGPVGLDGTRVYGDTVHLARRIASLAKPEQVLTTGETLRRLRSPLRTRFVERVHVKGRPDEVVVVEIVWGEGATIDIAETLAAAAPPPGELVLTLPDGREAVVSSTNPSVTLGRDRTCDLWVDDARISRLHARVELRRGVFVLVDLSRNGSTVIAQGAPPRKLVRREDTLAGEGVIRLGTQGEGTLVSFRARSLR